MAPRKLFGSLNLLGNIGKGENPNGQITQAPTGTFIDYRVPDGNDGEIRAPFKVSGPRWNKVTASMQDKHLPKPVSLTATPRRK
jgi:hypothetical protein